jgi:hypothetical protein
MTCSTVIVLVLYECGILLICVREEHNLRMYENKVLGRIFRIRRMEELT